MARSVYRHACSAPARHDATKRVRGGALIACMCMLCTPALAQDSAPAVVKFSAAKAGTTVPAPWAAVKINDRKTPTKYDLVDDGGTIVLHAMADKAASALGQPINASINATPWLQWRWKLEAPIASADNTVGQKEDAPARVILEFDGDVSKLPLSDRTVNKVSEQLSGRPLPYATLMYIYANQTPVGTLIANPHTRRIQMIVVATGDSGVGAWQSFRRNVVEDYKRAFKEEPGKLLSLGVMTDTDNTGEKTQAWYGDLTLSGQQN